MSKNVSHSCEHSYEHMVFSWALVTHNCYHENHWVSVNLSLVWFISGMPGSGTFLSSLRSISGVKSQPSKVPHNCRWGKSTTWNRFCVCLMSLCHVMWLTLTAVLLVAGNKLTDSRDNSQPTNGAYRTKGCDRECYTEWPKVNFNSPFKVLS